MLFSKTKLLNQEYEESNTFCPVVVFVYASDNNFKISEQEGRHTAYIPRMNSKLYFEILCAEEVGLLCKELEVILI